MIIFTCFDHKFFMSNRNQCKNTHTHPNKCISEQIRMLDRAESVRACQTFKSFHYINGQQAFVTTNTKLSLTVLCGSKTKHKRC